ncbi:hypothetical protein ABTZ98_33435 [Streptomyces bacillaris]|uniref:hypothetical protein n=1 Tax=unclassified Micromonospora TaxID=2617518 RepID=UPI00334CA0B2
MELRTNPDGSLTLNVPASYGRTLGADGMMMLDWFSSALIAMARLRDGDQVMTANDWHNLINDTEHRLTPRLQGIRDALIRAHAAAGGSYGDLALAMDVPKGTAQYRRDKLTAAQPSTWERWADGTLADFIRADWSASVTVRHPETGEDHTVQLDRLSGDQAAELETLISSDPEHTVTIRQSAGSCWTFRAAEVQVVRVERTRTAPTRTTPAA